MSDPPSQSHGPDGPVLVPNRSAVAFKYFTRYTRWYVARHFHAVRTLKRPDEAAPLLSSGAPVVVYLNHASWWDPLICVLLADRFFPDFRHYAPIDAEALERYGLLSRLGFFGVEAKTRRGAVNFIRTASAILDMPRAALWMTPQGRFCDPRVRPVELRPGLAHLARSLSRVCILPLAIEYPFWHQRTPEVLVHWGRPIEISQNSAGGINFDTQLRMELQSAQDALAAAAITQDPQRFTTLLGGAAGVGGVYDLWRRARAAVRGEIFDPEHPA